MQQISRIYLGNCGYETAWYDGVVLDMRDLDFNAPTDTVLNLENGGGKTSLLSLIFSCFETSQDRFLKHIQSRNNHFSQYFANDGTLGLIMVEWLMPPKRAGEGQYRLITGQAVAVRTTAEPADIERRFFSFEEDDTLSLDQVPGPRLVDEPIQSLAEFSRWIHDQQRANPGNAFITPKQSDWHRHLEACLIDIEMLRMQVDFSAQEGGFDTGFLNFKSEVEFLRKFFGLTLDTQRASSVRNAVATACDKLRRKPHFQRQLCHLQSFSGALATFSTAAEVLKQQKVQRISLTWTGLRLAEALAERAAALETDAASDATFSETQLGIAKLQGEAAQAFIQEHTTLTDLSFRRAATRATDALTGVKLAQDDADKDLLHVRAAQLQRAIKAAQKEVTELNALSARKTQELAPYLEKVQRDGALFRRALNNAAEALREQVKTSVAETNARNVRTKDLGEEARKQNGELLAHSTERAQLDAQGNALLVARGRLVKDGALESDDESATATLGRWGNLKSQLEAEQEAFAEQQAQFEADAAEGRRSAETAMERASSLSTEISTKNVFVAEGTAHREHLTQSAALTSAAEADLVSDLESLSLVDQLDKRINSFGLQITGTDIRLAELTADNQAIENTGVAGFSPDVALVVQKLQAAGIRSAQPFNQYLAKAIPDAVRARTLVQSDPARFWGVCVASAELDLCRKVQWSLQLPVRPVMVSQVVLEAEAPKNAVVVPSSTDAAYNIGAAQALKQKLESSQDSERSTKHQLDALRNESLASRTALLTYREKYGGGKLAAAQERLKTLAQERDAELKTAAAAKAKEASCNDAAKAFVKRIKGHETTLTSYKAHITALGRFLSDHESLQSGRLARTAALDQLLESVLKSIEANKAEADAIQGLNIDAARTVTRLALLAEGMDTERSNLTHHDFRIPAQELLKDNPTSLEALRDAYKAAESVYNSNAESRLGAVHVQLQVKQSEITDKQRAFTKQFSGVTGTDLVPFRDADLDALLPAKEALAATLRAQVEPAVEAKATALSAHQQWAKTNKVRFNPATREQAALDDKGLTAAQTAAEASRQFAADKANTANQSGEFALTQSKIKASEAKGLNERAGLLRASLQLEQQPERPLVEVMLQAASRDLAQLQASFTLEADSLAQVQGLVSKFNEQASAYTTAEKGARKQFDALKTAALAPDFVQVEPDLASQMRSNEFESSVGDSQRLSSELSDRIATVESNLSDMAQDFEAAAEELHSLTQVATSTLSSATRKTVPSGAPYIGGKAVLKMRSHLGSISAEDRRRVLHHYLDRLIESGIIPARGTDLAADALLALNGKALGLQVLKMVIEESQQYVAMDKITNSGGEGVVMAMFLYLVISQLRSDMQAREQKAGGGPLILDNPFAKATTPALWKAQRMLANAMGVQLIFATAVQDYNTLGEFGKFVRLRRAGQNTKTRRWHLETADFQLNEATAEAN